MSEAWLGRGPDWPPEEGVDPVWRPERRVQVLRRIDPWSALKVSLVLYLCLFVVFLGVGVVLWIVGREIGAIGNLEGLIEDLGLYAEDSFRFKDGEILVLSLVIGPILVVLAALATVAGVALFNLAARLLGGVEVTVQDDDPGGR
jgi:hypothetical protein